MNLILGRFPWMGTVPAPLPDRLKTNALASLFAPCVWYMYTMCFYHHATECPSPLSIPLARLTDPKLKNNKKKTPDSDCSEIFQNCPDALYFFFFSYRGACQWKPWLQVSRVFGDPILRTDYWVVLNQIMPAGSASQAATYGDCFGFGWHFSNCVLHQ